MSKSIRRATLAEINKMKDDGLLYETRPDAAEKALPDEFWENAEPFIPPDKTSVHLRLDSDVLDWFKRQGKGHLTRMNAVLRSYYEARRKKPS